MTLTWFRRGPVDPVAEQLREVERRGNSTIWLAHIAAFLILVVFSLGSLVGLTGDALNAIVAQFRDGRGTDYTAAIAIGVSTLLVFSMDIAMYYAAMRIRLLRQRRDGDGIALHVVIIGGVSIVEAASYTYMSWLYDHPANYIVWVIIIGRALCAPLLAAYLSLATPMPLGERDIRYAVEKVAGHGVITKMIVEAGASNVSLERQLALYQASTQGFPQLIRAEKESRQAALPPPSSAADSRYAIAAQPTTQLPPVAPSSRPPHPTRPRSMPFPPDRPDDDGPDGDGGGLDPYREEDNLESVPSPWFATGEIPAISGVRLNGHSPKTGRNSADADGDADDDTDEDIDDSTAYGRAAGNSRPRVTIDARTRALAAEGKAARRRRVVAECLRENADVKVGTVRRRLRKEGVGADWGKVKLWVDMMADELGVERHTEDDDDAPKTLPRLRAVR